MRNYSTTPHSANFPLTRCESEPIPVFSGSLSGKALCASLAATLKPVNDGHHLDL